MYCYEIEKGIPIPDMRRPGNKNGMGRGHKIYPFANMKIGDSFVIPPRNGINYDARRQSMLSSLRKFNKLHKTKIKITSRSSKSGLRVWRIE